MFLFKCCTNHTSESRRSNISPFNTHRRPLQIFIKTSVKAVANSPVDETTKDENLISCRGNVSDSNRDLIAGVVAGSSYDPDLDKELGISVDINGNPLTPEEHSNIGSSLEIEKNGDNTNCQLVFHEIDKKSADEPYKVSKRITTNGHNSTDANPGCCQNSLDICNNSHLIASLDEDLRRQIFSSDICDREILNCVQITQTKKKVLHLNCDEYQSVLFNFEAFPTKLDEHSLQLSHLLTSNVSNSYENLERSILSSSIESAKSSNSTNNNHDSCCNCYDSFESGFCHSTTASSDDNTATSTSTPTRASIVSQDEYINYKPLLFSSSELIDNDLDVDNFSERGGTTGEFNSCSGDELVNEHLIKNVTIKCLDEVDCDHQPHKTPDNESPIDTNSKEITSDLQFIETKCDDMLSHFSISDTKRDETIANHPAYDLPTSSNTTKNSLNLSPTDPTTKNVEHIPKNISHNFNFIDLNSNENNNITSAGAVIETDESSNHHQTTDKLQLQTDSEFNETHLERMKNEEGILMNESSAMYLNCLLSSASNFHPSDDQKCANYKLIFEPTDAEHEEEEEEDDENEEDENDNYCEEATPVFTSEGLGESEEISDMQPQTRDLESYLISEPTNNVGQVSRVNPYNLSTETQQNVSDFTNNLDSLKSTKSLNFTDALKQTSCNESSDKLRTGGTPALDFQRFYSKSTPNINSDVDKMKSSLTLIEEYFNKYIIDCETNDDDEEEVKIDGEGNEGSNVDPNSSCDSSPLDADTSSQSKLISSNNESKSNQTTHNQPMDTFSEICKKFSSTCLNILQTSYPSLHTTGDSCPSISTMSSSQQESNSSDSLKNNSQSAATLSALYAAIFPAFGTSEDSDDLSNSASNHFLVKETCVDDQVLIGKPELVDKKPNPVRRCLSLKVPESPSTKEVRKKKKKVKFADAFGLELAIVRLILSGENLSDEAFQQRFQAATASYQTNFNNQNNNNNIVAHKTSTNRSSCLKGAVDSTSAKSENVQSQSTPGKRIIADFVQPGNSEDFSTKVWLQNVVLESCLAEKKSNSISGCIRVYNLTYRKEVIVRYTMNKWATYSEHKASYIYGSNDGNSDRFSFLIALPPYFDVGNTFEFAIIYRTSDGREFWDNNHGRNYTMTCQKC
ncbi:hypothetical protein HELRODRAFT_194764 [Helobdella robusta]|uniref:CBM21 domain-containing protein n=1 Tax=Helobdella robusta TaxID=6412 RepID=T1FWE0_HELRO|nr:hypothetical protein HELRODRAFT_194764 [Helobdella robusta]ESN89924.1 hypothetical protein HELRODRAFT_194764 [Helobdella robusta]